MMPSTAGRYGVPDVYDPRENIRAAVQHLKYLSIIDHRPSTRRLNAGENAANVSRHSAL
jgi:soluble lytic murein transglycosylase-like protein